MDQPPPLYFELPTAAVEVVGSSDAPPAVRTLAVALCSLAYHSMYERLFALLDAHRDDALAVDSRFVDAEGRTPLHYAAVNGDRAAVEGLASRCPLLVSSVDREGNAPLAVAVRHCNLIAARALLRCGANADAANFQGRVALHYALANADVSAARLLLEANAFVGATDADGASTMHWAAVGRADSVAQQQQRHAPAVDGGSGGVASCIALLLANGAYCAARDSVGDTPLHWAAREANATSVRALLDAGADARLVNADGETAQAIARCAVHGEQALARDSDAGRNAMRCVELLVDAEARFGAKKSPLESNAASTSAPPMPRYVFV